MARYRKKRRSSGKMKTIPVLPLIPIAYRVYNSATASGSFAAKINEFSAETIGYIPSTGQLALNRAMPFWVGEGVAIVGHKMANKTGINKYVRKMTMGYFSL